MNAPLSKSRQITQSITAGAVALLLPSMAQAVDAEFAKMCEGYATEALQIREKMVGLGCDVSANAAFDNGDLYGTLFDPSRKAHFDWCLTMDVDPNRNRPTGEGLKRMRALKECKDQAARKSAKEQFCPPGFRVLDTTAQGGTMQCIPTEEYLKGQVGGGGAQKTCTVHVAGAVYSSSTCKNQTREIAAGTQGVTLLGKEGEHCYNIKWPEGEGWVYSGPGWPTNYPASEAITCN